MDYISFDIFDFISYVKTLMKKIKYLGLFIIPFTLFWYNYSSAVDIFSSSAWKEFWQAVETFVNWTTRIFNFIWEIIQFIFYGFRTIIFLLRNLLQSVLFWFTSLFTRLIDTFTTLSLFLWPTTSLIVSMFCIALLFIIFWFLLRFFTWRFHYKKVSNGK